MSFNIFFNKKKFLEKYFRSLLVTENFRLIEQDSYVIKTNRFGDIVTGNFFNLSVNKMSAGCGVMRYNVDESIILADWNISPKPVDANKKIRDFCSIGLVHLRKISFPFKMKVSLIKAKKNTPDMFFALPAIVGGSAGNGFFSFSSDTDNQSSSSLPSGLTGIFDDSGLGSVFFKTNPVSCMIISDTGWVLFSAGPYTTEVLNGMLALDKKISEILARKNG